MAICSWEVLYELLGKGHYTAYPQKNEGSYPRLLNLSIVIKIAGLKNFLPVKIV